MIFTKMVGFAKKNVVLMVAVLAAVITSFIIPPDEQYISYFDFMCFEKYKFLLYTRTKNSQIL